MISCADHSLPESLRILVVDDHEVNREFLQHGLKDRLARVDAASSAAEAVERCRRSEYDLILMDLHMPGRNGLDAARSIRELDHPSAGAEILFLTADARREERQRLAEAGFDHCLSKPVGLDELLEAMACLHEDGRLPKPRRDEDGMRPALLATGDALHSPSAHGTRARQLRHRFGRELEKGLSELEQQLFAGQSARARARLHQWSGAAGFVGAMALGQACRELHRALDSRDRFSVGQAWLNFNRTARATTALLLRTAD